MNRPISNEGDISLAKAFRIIQCQPIDLSRKEHLFGGGTPGSCHDKSSSTGRVLDFVIVLARSHGLEYPGPISPTRPRPMGFRMLRSLLAPPRLSIVLCSTISRAVLPPSTETLS